MYSLRNAGPLGPALVAVLTLAILLTASIVNSRVYTTGEQETREIQRAQTERMNLLVDQLDEETGIRGYLTTGEESFLEPYREAVPRFDRDIVQLHDTLTGLHAEWLLALIDQERSLNDRWKSSVATPVLSREPEARSSVREGKAIVDAFRSSDEQLESSLENLLVLRQTESEHELRVSGYITLGLIVLTAIIVVFGSWRASRNATRMRAEMEAQLIERERARQFDAIVATIPQIVFTTDARGRVTYVNERWYEFTGESRENTVDSDAMLGRIHPADRPIALTQWRLCLAARVPFEMEYRVLGHDGRYNWFDVRAVPESSGDEEPAQWFGSFTDVEEQHRERESTQKVADALQDALLPERLPTAENVEFDATYIAAEDIAHVGGDWYDVLERPDGRYLFSIGDVTGHGLPAAIDMGKARHAILALAAVYEDPAELLRHANTALRMQTEALVSALIGVYDATTGDLIVASAGHPPGLVVRDRESIALGSSAPPLGILERIEPTTMHERLELGDLFVCYTDGIIEQNRDVVAGERTLREVASEVQRQRAAHPARLIRRKILGAKRGRDDVAILTIRRSVATTAVLGAVLP